MISMKKWQKKIEAAAVKNGIEFLGRIKYDKDFTKAQIQEKTLIEFACTETGEQIKSIWSKLCQTK